MSTENPAWLIYDHDTTFDGSTLPFSHNKHQVSIHKDTDSMGMTCVDLALVTTISIVNYAEHFLRLLLL